MIQQNDSGHSPIPHLPSPIPRCERRRRAQQHSPIPHLPSPIPRCERRRRAQQGVTLIEMLVVVMIMMLFAALVGPQIFKQGDKARVTAAHAQVSSFMTALGSYKLDTGIFPTTEQGLQALRTKPENVGQWNGPYLAKDIPLDPWGHAYIYKYPGERGDEPDVICYGADGQPGGEGINADVVSWK